jgi:catalase
LQRTRHPYTMNRAPFPSALVRYAAIAAVVAIAGGAFAWTAGTFDRFRRHPPLTAARLMDAFEADAGKHAGFRRNHAKGVCVSGYFDGNGNGAALSRASVFTRARTPVIGRFSAPGGNPSERDGDTTVRSFALYFRLADGEQWRTGMNSAPVFAVRTPQAVYAQLRAARPDPRTGKPDEARVDAFAAAHPETHALADWLAHHPPSTQFYDASYFGINAFRFEDAHGHARFVRWRVVPDTPYAPLAANDPRARDPDFLQHGLMARLASGPLRWHLILTPAAPGDQVDDATRAWPAERDAHGIDAGTLVIEHAQSQIDGACRDINFDPLVLPDGIAPSGDPLLAARSAAYSLSFERRVREEVAAGIETPQ